MARPAHPWFYEAKNTWYVWLEDKKVSLGVKGKENKAEAIQAWHKLIAHGKPEPKTESITLADLVKAFLADAESRLKPMTAKVYGFLLNPFALTKRYGTIRADKLSIALVEAYTKAKTWSQSTKHDFLAALKLAYRFGERERLIASNPLTHLRKPTIASRGSKALVSPNDHLTLLEASPAYFKPFLKLLHLTGARPAEIASITAENFDEKQGLVFLTEHKLAHKGKARILFLCAEAIAILKALKAQYGEGYLLRNAHGKAWKKDSIVRMFRRLRARTGVKATAYGYRHSFATEALANGIPDAQVSALLGHSNTSMLHRHYSHLTSQAQALKEALGKIR